MIFDFFTINWRAANDSTYLSVKCPKIAMIDPLDEIVYLYSSLPVLAAKKACREKFAELEFFGEPKIQETLNNLMYLFDLEQILHNSL